MGLLDKTNGKDIMKGKDPKSTLDWNQSEGKIVQKLPRSLREALWPKQNTVLHKVFPGLQA